MSRESLVRITVIAAALAIPAAALAAVVAGPPGGGGCWLSFCSSLLCGG